MAKAYGKEIKEKARSLRRNGWSLGEISRKMAVPRNTISCWVKDIRLSEKQKDRIRNKIISSGAIGRSLAIKANREKINKWKEDIREKVKPFENYEFCNPEIGKLICGLLYLCEGAKYPSTRYLHFGNSDPKTISVFIKLLRKHFNINEDKLRFEISYRWDQKYDELRKFWSKITRISEDKCFRNKPDRRTKGKKTLRNDYKGVCKIVYYSTDLQFELLSIGEAIINGAEGS